MSKFYTCMWCWFKVFESVFSEDEICPICNFQDSIWAINSPFESPYQWGYHLNLFQIQQKSLSKYPLDIIKIRIYWKFFIWKTYYRNILWRPLNKKKINKNYDYYPKWKYDEYINKYPDCINDYHLKLFLEAQKYNPDEIIHL